MHKYTAEQSVEDEAALQGSLQVWLARLGLTNTLNASAIPSGLVCFGILRSTLLSCAVLCCAVLGCALLCSALLWSLCLSEITRIIQMKLFGARVLLSTIFPYLGIKWDGFLDAAQMQVGD